MMCAFRRSVLSIMIRRMLVAFIMLAVLGSTPCMAIQKSLKLITPSAGSLVITKKQRITWRSVGITNRVKLVLLKNGTEMGVIAKDLDPSVGRYEWVVGKYIGDTAPVGKGYKVRIQEQGGTFSDDSNIAFEITGIPPASGKMRAPRTYDFQINDLYVNKRGKLTAWIQSNGYDYSGDLRFRIWRDLGLGINAHVTKFVQLKNRQQDIVELGVVSSLCGPLVALRPPCEATFSVTILTDENIREINKANNRMAKDLSTWKTSARITRVKYHNRILKRGDSLSFEHRNDPNVRLWPLRVFVRNCGYLDITSGRIKVYQQDSSTATLKPCPLKAGKNKWVQFDGLVFPRTRTTIIVEYAWDEPGSRQSGEQFFSFHLKVNSPF